MVKITRKILTQKASLRQAVRSNIGKSINLHKIIPHNEKSNLALHSNSNMSNFSEYNIQNIIPNENSSINRDSLSRNNNSFLSQSINNNKSEHNINNNDQEKYFQELNGYENRNIIQEENASTSENEERDYYFQELIDDESNDIGDNDQENYNQRLDECEDSDEEDISFIFKNKYDGFQNTSFYHGEAKPYFPNKSVMLMFIWYTKYMIGTRAYQDLVKILQHPDFCASDLPQSITTLKQMRHNLPLMTLNSHNVKINPMDTPSTSVSVKEGYTFSILDYIQRILNNPSIFPKLYFGFGVETLEKFELWHGQVWKESPLFGETSHMIKNEFYQAGDFILYNSQEEAGDNQQLGQINGIVIPKENSFEKLLYVQKIMYYSDLPGNVKSSKFLQFDNHNFRVLLTKQLYFLIEYTDLYIHNNRSKIRQIHQQHQLPNQHNFQRLSFPLNLQHLKFFIDLYYNDFDAFGKSYYKLGGIYIQFGNMPLSMRQCFKNYFLIGLIPFDAKFADFIKPFIQQMQILQNGIIMTNYNGDKVIISGGLGMCIADLPQGNNLAGIRRHHGCRTCEVTQEDLNNTYFDIQLNGRYCHIMDCYYKEIKQASTKSAKENIAKQHGLCLKKNILDNLIRNPYIQVPQDPYHCLAGLVRHLFDETFKSMNDEGHKIFVKIWREFEMPSSWNRLQNPITHRDSYWMNDSLRLTMIMPYILARAINYKHYKTEIVNRIKDKYSLSNQTQVPSIIVDCWVKMAKACKAVFKSTYIVVDEYNDYILLKKRLEQVTEALLKVFRETFSNLPNLHALHHLPEIARNFGMLVNTSVSLKEAVHGLYKRTVLHTNKKDLSMDLSKRDNTLQTLRYLLDGGLDEINNFFTNFANDTILHKLLDDWYITENGYITTKNNSEIFSIHPDFQNIQVYGLWKQFKIQEQGLSTTLSTENLLTEITKIYKDVYKNFSAIIQRRVNYYDSIQFTVHLESDVYVNITLRVGEAIDVEVADSHGEQSYALIRVIMIHQDDSGNNNPFLLIDWFYRNGNVDSVTGFPIYGLQRRDDDS
ncbi:hypothetical protein RhiirA1_448603 [Rhizophagus irregularis]|uniref:BAH domain-containing protein n=1 Tax=Rhizophagus irregularis TaxID=588596 RepID=A0A2N0SJ23_9GLOM|nr:hypothetical protein RhiirA1_448603 [Rhizophagus irregularis]